MAAKRSQIAANYLEGTAAGPAKIAQKFEAISKSLEYQSGLAL
jgi:hypothetical protein